MRGDYGSDLVSERLSCFNIHPLMKPRIDIERDGPFLRDARLDHPRRFQFPKNYWVVSAAVSTGDLVEDADVGLAKARIANRMRRNAG